MPGYIEKVGDIPGWGQVNGRGGITERVVNCNACGDLCNADSDCQSYECSSSTKLCGLNTQKDPYYIIKFESV